MGKSPARTWYTVAQDWAIKFYKSAPWIKNRRNYLTRPLDTPHGICPPGMCERCFERGKLVPAKVVHHKKHLTPQNVSDPKVALAYDNLQRLCQDCHAVVHSGRQESRVTFDENGNVMPKITDKDVLLRDMVMQLTESVDERRNIHKEAR